MTHMNPARTVASQASACQKYNKDNILITSAPGGRSFYQRVGKRIVDVTLIVLSLPVVVPLILLACLPILRDGGLPIFGHRRAGQGGAAFHCWKLRTMVADADQRLQDHLATNPEAKREWHENFKLEADPRVTRFGDFLRRSSLDELPQLWNVLRGEMSLVGPRPVTAEELIRYGADLPAYLAQKPGITGNWQVNGRGSATYAERVQMDVIYAAECSLKTDLVLIVATFFVMLRRTGR